MPTGISGGASGFSSSSTSGSNSGGAGGSTHNGTFNPIDTGDPNWQATKSSVRERNAAMFNNDLMADIRFVVGSDGKCSCYKISLQSHL